MLEEDTIIWLFEKSLKPSLRVEIEERGWELNIFKKIVIKAVETKGKAVLKYY